MFLEMYIFARVSMDKIHELDTRNNKLGKMKKMKIGGK